MNDYTPTTPESNEFDELANLRSAFENAKEDIARMRNNFDFASQAVESWKIRFDRIKAVLQEFIDEGDITDGNALDDYLIEEFDLELTKEVEVKITVTFSAVMTIPKDDDASDYASDLEISDLEMNHDTVEITSISCDNYEIEEV
jgi:hypothetical protein